MMERLANVMIEETANKLADNYGRQQLFEVGVGEKMPNRNAIVEIVSDLKKLSFPGYFGTENLAYVSKKDFAGNMLAELYEKLFRQIKVAFWYGHGDISYDQIRQRAEDATQNFISRIPNIQELLIKDVEAEFMGDPAAQSKEEIIFSYPGLYAIFVYRYAHVLYDLEVPLIPRIMTEHAHGKTGIDIHPGAQIGEYFFIDHGTGIVIGETTKIGNHVKLYQGVTLGALSTRKGQALSGIMRHPTIEDYVVIYANTTVLGGKTVIGENSVIAGNSFITASIPANTKVSSIQAELEIKGNI